MARIMVHRTSKAHLADVVRDLAEQYGLGDRSIALLLGFSDRYIRMICADNKIVRNRGYTYRDRLLRGLDPTARAKCEAIHSRSVGAATNGIAGQGTVSPRLRAHSVLDEDMQACNDSPRQVASAADVPAIPSLADLLR